MFFKSLDYRGPAVFTELVTEGNVIALTRFNCRFLNSDHHLHHFELGGKPRSPEEPNSNSFRFNFSDSDHGILGREFDEMELSVGYVNFEGSPFLSSEADILVSGIGNRSEDVSVSIPRPSEDEVVALSGFGFHHINNEGNHHIRTIQVRYFPDTSEFIVRFRDNSPEDDEYRFFVLYTLLKKAQDIPWNYELRDIQRQRVEFVKEASVAKEVPGRALLAGFSFQFLDNDHHIRRIAVNVEERDNLYVCFTDDEEDNPVLGFVDYIPIAT